MSQVKQIVTITTQSLRKNVLHDKDEKCRKKVCPFLFLKGPRLLINLPKNQLSHLSGSKNLWIPDLGTPEVGQVFFFFKLVWSGRVFPGGSVVNNLPTKAEDAGQIPVSGRSPGEGNSNPLQYSCLINLMDSGSCQAVAHGVPKKLDMTQ